MAGGRKSSSKPQQLVELAQQLRAVGRDNVDSLVQKLFRVVDPAGKVVPFRYKHGQAHVARILAEHERLGKPSRVYILKSRQIGLTTLIANRNFVKTLCTDNRRAVTVAHQDHRAMEILSKIKFAYANLPDQIKFPLSQDSRECLGFADFNSKMLICSANNIELVRGDTYQDEHVSELTRYKDQELAMFELLQVCHRLPGTSVVIETTGKRYGSYAHDLWRQSIAKNNQFEPIFLPWQDDPGCDLDGGRWSDQERDNKLKEIWEYEPRLIDRAKLFNLKAGCSYWAYLQLREQALGNWEQFLEDYPCSDEEAWRSKGDLFFESTNLIKLSRRLDAIPFLGFNLSLLNLEDGFKTLGELQENKRVDIHSPDSYLMVWRTAQPGRRYVVGGDSGAGTVGGDPSSSFVTDMMSGEMMAEFHGVCQPHQHARIIESLCRMYNDALAAPEINSLGMATLQELQRKYPYIFIWRPLDDNKQRLSNKLGWYTGIKSRSLMLLLLRRAVEEAANNTALSEGCFRSKGLLDEMRTFIDDPETGKAEAARGCHDDRIMSLAINWYVSQIETKGAREDILNMLRPVELDGIGLSNLSVEDTLLGVRKQLRLEEYNPYG